MKNVSYNKILKIIKNLETKKTIFCSLFILFLSCPYIVAFAKYDDENSVLWALITFGISLVFEFCCWYIIKRIEDRIFYLEMKIENDFEQ